MKKLKFRILIIIAVLLIGEFYLNGNTAFAVSTTDNKKTVENGIYIIRTALNEKYVLDIAGASKENFGNTQIWSNFNANNQKFRVKYLGDGYYNIISKYSGKTLDVDSAGTKPGSNVQQYELNNTDAQKWLIKKDEDGYYTIISKCNNLCLDITSANAKDGTNVQVYTQNNTKAQRFKLERCKDEDENNIIEKAVEDGVYKIKTALNEKYVLDIADASKENFGNVQLWTDFNATNQAFEIKYINDGYYNIISKYSGKTLDVDSAGTKPGTNVQQYELNNTDAQKWLIKKDKDGYYTIISKCNNLCLDITSANAKDGTNVQVYTQNNSKAQKFKLEKNIQKEDEPIEPTKPTKTLEDGIYSIRSKQNKNYVLDVAEASKDNGANVQVWENFNSLQQMFKIQYDQNGYYKITNFNSKKVLDVYCALNKEGTNVQQYQSNNSDAQKWEIKLSEDKSSYYIISKCNGLYLNVEGEKVKNGANVEVNKNTKSDAQKFIFDKIDTTIKLDTTKYPGYKEQIEKLMELHPNWNFEFLYTGLNFSDAVAGEYAVRSANLVPTSYGGEWISGTTLYDTGWYGASEKAIARFMDPRNFLNEIDVFQFQDVNDYLYGVCTLEGIQEQVNNSFLQDYAIDIDTACRNENVNPYYIIARLFQENGRKPKNGTYKMNGGDGKYYYNPFNIGATGNSKSEVYNNALARAKREGWDTMVKALQGGIYFCKKNWLENYQNTLYQNKFDIDSTNGTDLYSHQYMQNLFGAYNEAKSLQGMYSKTGKVDSDFTFIIPLYENMPKELSPEPVNNQESYIINVRTTGTYIRIRSDASTDSTILREIPNKGTVLLSVQRGINSNWHKIITTDGLIGYVSGTYLEQIDDVKTCNYTAKVKTNDGDGCFIRIGPSTNLDKIMGLSEGTHVTVIDDSTYKNINGYDWSRIMLSNGTQAFMPSKFLAK